ncbi:MAG: lipoprotein NlpI [Gammaproteobacteria bacterium]|nr:lipoprotein NlpI [Gammaproteobacteria bacterium]MBU2058936.1 lipoprotein NlpI [Gammaproteobacteria bacterium]MBU2175075.1 lipoprotein NlpI [Gammaproteobacteria bacterium]MBU2246758.1 lipoprotein NlpI [Gammaproteobacteria bacterium]MBU2345944.1 lipoprotein NlpI [Gammaproteobacteria bacterium]
MLLKLSKVSDLTKKAVLLAALLALGACAQKPATEIAAVLVENPLEPEPVAVSYRTEIAIARISELLTKAETTDEQRARLFYDRGVMYDSVGLRSLARFDFLRALRLQPDMADAYNFIGIHHTLVGNYTEAYESFDAALELAPDYDYAYLNRGIALLYDSKTALAVGDFEQFYQAKPDDPYRSLWLYFADANLSVPEAQARLALNQAKLDPDHWASKIVAFYLGKISEQELLDAAATLNTDPQQLAERLCEVYFYLAKWHQQQNPTKALDYYKKVLATNVYEFVEHRYARIEMNRLRGLDASVLPVE